MQPKIPNQINEFAASCLEALKMSGIGTHISLGGAFGLALYHEFRTTKDVDAWWMQDTTEAEKREVILLIEKTLNNYGEVKKREFGDVVSLDLYKDGQIVFNFQIANRSAQVRPNLLSPWDPVRLDAFDDLVASKMSALTQRGIPRDFLDIFEICEQKLCTIQQCWQFWGEREKKRGVENPGINPAKSAILVHLKRIEKMRPLDAIKNVHEKKRANKVREWFKNEFIGKEIRLD